MVARSVDWRWIGGGEVKGVGGRVAVVWWLNGGRTSGGGGRVVVVLVAREVELRWIGGGAVGGLAVNWWWQG